MKARKWGSEELQLIYHPCLVKFPHIDEVYGRDDRASLYLRVHGTEGTHVGSVAERPGPNAVGRVLACGHTRLVERMLGKELLRTQDEVVDEVGSLLLSLLQH